MRLPGHAARPRARLLRETRFAFRLAAARAYLDTVGRQWDDALGRLKHFVEET
jgi:hypothetical protein